MSQDDILCGRGNFVHASEQQLNSFTEEKSSSEDPRLSMLVRDVPGWRSNFIDLHDAAMILLLTPVVFPVPDYPTEVSDPFEPLGRSLSRRHSAIRHVPYTRRHGITQTHVTFIRYFHAIVLVIVPREEDGDIEMHNVDLVFGHSQRKPIIVVVCYQSLDPNRDLPFPTAIQTLGYSPDALEATAALIFKEDESDLGLADQFDSKLKIENPQAWPVEKYDEARDISSIMVLWNQTFSQRFMVDLNKLASLLRRPGYAKHYVVRRAKNGELLGFCATYLTRSDRAGERLIGSLALILVHSAYQQRGIGSSLHNCATRELKGTKGVFRLQLGSTFPRILYGPLTEMKPQIEWFQRRGWQLDKNLAGKGQIVRDLLLNFNDWSYRANGSTKFQFRLNTLNDAEKILELVENNLSPNVQMGWFDQYWTFLNGPSFRDAVVVVYDSDIVAVALTYIPSASGLLPLNLPWAGVMGNDIGGITCICLPAGITRETKAEILNGLISTSVVYLRNKGMNRLFLDGTMDDADDLLKLGFHEWASYKDVWSDI